MWVLFAFLSAFFAGITSILAKIGMEDTDSNLATALRTIVVAIFAWVNDTFQLWLSNYFSEGEG